MIKKFEIWKEAFMKGWGDRTFTRLLWWMPVLCVISFSPPFPIISIGPLPYSEKGLKEIRFENVTKQRLHFRACMIFGSEP